MRKYAVIYRAVLMENLQYAANVAMGFVSYAVFIFVFINLWNYIYSPFGEFSPLGEFSPIGELASPGEFSSSGGFSFSEQLSSTGKLIAGYTKEQMIWYVMITETIWFGTGSGAVARQATADIRGGNIAYRINKPYHYVLYILAKYTGEWSLRLPMFGALAAVMGLTLVGEIPNFRAVTLLAVLPVIVLGVTIHAVFKLCISLIAFWVEDSNPFQWLYDKVLLIVGTIFPVEIFPAALQPVLKLTPIYTVCYGPAKLIVDFSAGKCLEILLAQILYLSVGCGLVFFIYGRGVKKIYVNGG